MTLFTGSNAFDTFVGGSGITMPARDAGATKGYVDSLNRNFTRVQNVVDGVDQRLTSVEASSGLAAQADAAGNIPNLLVNGAFNLSTAGGIDDTYGWPYDLDYIENVNTATAMFGRCVGWWLAAPSSGASPKSLGARITSRLGSAPSYDYGVDNALLLWGNQTPNVGSVFQRVDFFYPLRWLDGRTVQFSVKYTSLVADGFYLEISDGVNSTNNMTVSRPAGTDVLSTVSHVVSSDATKLTVRIVVTDGTFTELNPLKVSLAYGRVGAGQFTLPTQTMCRPSPLDSVAAAMLYREMNRDLFVPSMVDPTGSVTPPATGQTVTEVYREWESFEIPMLYENANDVVLQQNVAQGPDNLPNDISKLATQPLVTHIVRDWIQNTATDTASTKKQIVEQAMTIYRLATDPSVGLYTGFSGRFQSKLAVIPMY
jgi:hypothetical protein